MSLCGDCCEPPSSPVRLIFSRSCQTEAPDSTRAEYPSFHQTTLITNRGKHNDKLGWQHTRAVGINLKIFLKRGCDDPHPPSRPPPEICPLWILRTMCMSIFWLSFFVVRTADSKRQSRTDFRVRVSAPTCNQRSFTTCAVLHRRPRHTTVV